MKRPFNIKAVCKLCGKIFGTYTWEIKRGYGKYCSVVCRNLAVGYSKNRPRDQLGSKNPNWKNGISKDNYRYKLIQIKRYPQKMKARRMCYDAVRRGHIKKKPCEICGDIKVHAHHDDYSKPLEVRWMCPKHHRLFHQILLPVTKHAEGRLLDRSKR